MTEQRCPMCGKDNPGDLEECQFCQARLKPLIIQSENDISSGEENIVSLPDIPLPDWLDSLGKEEQLSDDPVGREEKTEFGVDDDDRRDQAEDNLLDALRAQTTDDFLDKTEPDELIADDSPDWLKRIRILYDADTEEEFNLAKSTGELAQDELVDNEAPGDIFNNDLSMLKEIFPETSPDENLVLAEKDTFIGDLIGDDGKPERIDEEDSIESGETDFADGVPDWLEGLGQDKLEKDIETTPPPDFEEDSEPDPTLRLRDDTEFGDLPDWLSDLTKGDVETESPLNDDDLFLSEESLPDWIQAEITEEQTPADFTDEQAIEPAEIPEWMEAMRPSVDVLPELADDEASEEYVESAGPLAGLRSALVAEPEIAKLKEPSNDVGRLRVAERQQAHAALLEEMIASEGASEKAPQSRKDQNQRIIRWLVSSLLLIILVYQVINTPEELTLSDAEIISSGVQDTDKAIEQIAQGEAVLVGFDYQPAYSGEMDVAASVVFDHLMKKGALLTIISTNPTGPILAEGVLKNYKDKYGYESGEQYINLGFLPGGASGLLAFYEAPRLIAPGTAYGTTAWETKPLENVSDLTDFSLVVLLTDDPDITRTWIEQIQPNIKDVPLIIFTSAQAEPLVMPYYRDGEQVSGLVGGISGATAYGRITGERTRASNYWTAYNAGLMTAGAIIILGIIYNLFRLSSNRNRTRRPKA